MATYNWNMKQKNIIQNNSYVIWSNETWRILIIYFNPIKNLILICVKENRLVDAEYSKQMFYFFKVLNIYTKKIPFKLAKKYKRINITHF